METAYSEIMGRSRHTDSLVLARHESPARNKPIKASRGIYPELLARVTLRFSDRSLLFRDEPELVAESSPLFWDKGAPAQMLLWAQLNDRRHWSLSLTRWGVPRWELAELEPGAAFRSRRVLAELEPRESLLALVDVEQTFYVGITIAGKHKKRLRLVVGAAEVGHSIVSYGEFDPPELRVFPSWVMLGGTPDGKRRLATTGADIHVEELLLANTARFDLFDTTWTGETGISVDQSGESGLACRLDEQHVRVYPGPSLDGTTSNYWHNFRVTDRRIRRVHIGTCNGMSTCFFAGNDDGSWETLPVRSTGESPYGQRTCVLELPERDGPLRIANSPVYSLAQRDRELEQAQTLGAMVETAATSRGGLPLSIACLTDPSTPIAGKKGFLLLCGQHSPVEEMTGFLGLPMLRELAGLHEAEGPHQGLLQRLAVYWIPIFNVDCAHLGLPGMTLDNSNPNRKWLSDQGPEQQGVEEYFLKQRTRGVELGLMIDAHAGGGWRNHNILADYHELQDKVDQARRDSPGVDPLPILTGPDRAKHIWFERLDRVAGLRELWENGHSGVQSRAPEWFQKTFGCPSFTIECGVTSQLDSATRRTRPFTLEAFRQLGRDLAHTIADGLD